MAPLVVNSINEDDGVKDRRTRNSIIDSPEQVIVIILPKFFNITRNNDGPFNLNCSQGSPPFRNHYDNDSTDPSLNISKIVCAYRW